LGCSHCLLQRFRRRRGMVISLRGALTQGTTEASGTTAEETTSDRDSSWLSIYRASMRAAPFTASASVLESDLAYSAASGGALVGGWALLPDGRLLLGFIRTAGSV
jgi:hypothetical protein